MVLDNREVVSDILRNGIEARPHIRSTISGEGLGRCPHDGLGLRRQLEQALLELERSQHLDRRRHSGLIIDESRASLISLQRPNPRVALSFALRSVSYTHLRAHET